MTGPTLCWESCQLEGEICSSRREDKSNCRQKSEMSELVLQSCRHNTELASYQKCNEAELKG